MDYNTGDLPDLSGFFPYVRKKNILGFDFDRILKVSYLILDDRINECCFFSQQCSRKFSLPVMAQLWPTKKIPYVPLNRIDHNNNVHTYSRLADLYRA
jgi:hypothetical protein